MKKHRIAHTRRQRELNDKFQMALNIPFKPANSHPSGLNPIIDASSRSVIDDNILVAASLTPVGPVADLNARTSYGAITSYPPPYLATNPPNYPPPLFAPTGFCMLHALAWFAKPLDWKIPLHPPH